MSMAKQDNYKFLSTPSARRATDIHFFKPLHKAISIHALREEGDVSCIMPQKASFSISIHALREEGDRTAMFSPRTANDFYPRPPRGGRPERVVVPDRLKGFLSTPSARRATRIQNGGTDKWVFLSTPSARRATETPQRSNSARAISIHALREEGDLRSTSSTTHFSISIHALREEGDLGTAALIQPKEISIHALREEGDQVTAPAEGWAEDFYPRPPRGGRQCHFGGEGGKVNISIHALREEGDSKTLSRRHIH